MRTSEAEENGYVCPKCGAPLAHDEKERGFVRHIVHNPECETETYGNGERD